MIREIIAKRLFKCVITDLDITHMMTKGLEKISIGSSLKCSFKMWRKICHPSKRSDSASMGCVIVLSRNNYQSLEKNVELRASDCE